MINGAVVNRRPSSQTSYDGQNISYDAIGNPTSYKGATLTWNGRQLASYTKDGLTVTYKYDADGLRTQKTVNGVVYNYGYENGKLVYERKGNEYEVIYRYDADGNLFTVNRCIFSSGYTSLLYAVNNTRGDVVALYKGGGGRYSTYTYDSWGKPVVEATEMSAENSVRYRGYVYDQETGLYYLQSRYYDPETGRFLNADDVDYIGYSGEDISYNAFAYCENNAVGHIRKIYSTFSYNNQVQYTVRKSSTIIYISKDNINIYTPTKGKYKDGKINVCIDIDGGIDKSGNIKGNPNIRIWNSYEITDENDMCFVLDVIMASKYFDKNVFVRSRMSYYIEWFGHNIAYQVTSLFLLLGFSSFASFNDRAKHVDLDHNEKYMAIWTMLYLFYLEGKHEEYN